MYRIIVSPRAKKELKSISRLYRKALIEAIDELVENPFAGKPLTRELRGMYSYRLGVYRVIYRISKKGKKISVLTAGHRATVYK